MASRIYTLSLALVTCALFASPGRAEPNEHFDDNYLALKLTLGFGGSSSASATLFGANVEESSSMGVSFGGAAAYMVPLHDYFALGGMLGINSWRTTAGADSGGGRNLAFDLAVVPQGKFAVMPDLELYASLPIGLTWDFLNEINVSNMLFGQFASGMGGTEFSGGGAIGFMIGFFVGARYLVTQSIGLFAELGYSHHGVSHTPEVTTMLGMTKTTTKLTDISVSYGQFGLNLGITF